MHHRSPWIRELLLSAALQSKTFHLLTTDSKYTVTGLRLPPKAVMTNLWFLCLMFEIMVTVAVAYVSFVSVKETNAFVPHSHTQAAHGNTLKLQKEK